MMRKRLANSRPARVAFQLEARLTQSTILSNVSSAEHRSIRYPQLQAAKLFNSSDRCNSPWQTFQETLSTQWQKN